MKGTPVQGQSGVTTILFTDIAGSTRLWVQEPERMKPALARHDAILRAAVEAHSGSVVKMTGDGVHAAFDDPLDAVAAVLELQRALSDPEATCGIALHVRCGLHVGVVEHRDNDLFGTPVNRAARIMAAAHGGQVLLSEPVADLVAISRRLGGRLNLAECFDAMGVLASHGGQHVQAGRLRGVAEALLGSLSSSDVLGRELTGPYHARSREALGDAAYDAARADGRALPREAAIEQATVWLAAAS